MRAKCQFLVQFPPIEEKEGVFLKRELIFVFGELLCACWIAGAGSSHAFSLSLP